MLSSFQSGLSSKPLLTKEGGAGWKESKDLLDLGLTAFGVASGSLPQTFRTRNVPSLYLCQSPSEILPFLLSLLEAHSI